jgi:hypothetical protein
VNVWHNIDVKSQKIAESRLVPKILLSSTSKIRKTSGKMNGDLFFKKYRNKIYIKKCVRGIKVIRAKFSTLS